MGWRHVHQLCDPTDTGDGLGKMTGAVRYAAEEMWNDKLKRGHFIDEYTRVFTVSLQLRSNSVGVRSRVQLMIEQTSLGAIFTSFDFETRTLSEFDQTNMMWRAQVASGAMCILLLDGGY